MPDLINPDDSEVKSIQHVVGGQVLHREEHCPSNATCPVWLSFNRRALAKQLVDRFASIIGNAKAGSLTIVDLANRNRPGELEAAFSEGGVLWNAVGEIAGELAAINEAVWGTEGPIS